MIRAGRSASWISLVVAISIVAGCGTAAKELEYKAAYDSKDCFALRNMVNDRSPLFYQGAVAAAFSDVDRAEELLGRVIEADPKSEFAYEARGLLVALYQRSARYRDALSQIEAMLLQQPGKPDLINAHAYFSTLAAHPEQRVVSLPSSRIQYSMNDGNLFIPLEINGRSARFIVDTGAGLSFISASEAERLGMRVETASFEMDSSGGMTFAPSMAVAANLRIGNAALENVSFGVVDDAGQPFEALPLGERGILGLPVLRALERIRWQSDGTFELGLESEFQNVGDPNVCFEGDMAIVQVGFEERQLPFVLDTGAVTTRMYSAFVEELGPSMQSLAKSGAVRINGVGGSAEIEMLTLPELTLSISAIPLHVQPAQILMQPTVPASRWAYGNLGIDVLNHADSADIDFNGMRLLLSSRRP